MTLHSVLGWPKLMRSVLLLLCVSFKATFASPAFYVIGEDYLLFSDSTGFTQLEEGLSLRTWALDSKECRLWATSQENNQLLAFVKGKKVQAIGLQGRILSDFNQGLFATASGESQIQLRNKGGKVVKKFGFDESALLKQMILLSSGETWSLIAKKTGELSLIRLDTNGKELKRVVLNSTDEFWGNARFFIDEIRDRIWVGYSSRLPHYAYAPLVEKLSLSGEKQGFYQWDERGFFFDGCVDSSGDFILARDLPTSPYTVPDYSFLEKIQASSQKEIQTERFLELETNRLVDSLACNAKGLFLATHSIFGSEPKQVLYGSENPKEPLQEVLKLPSRALKILLCTEN